MLVDFDTAVAAVTLTGSLLSCVATTCVLVSFYIYRHQMRNFRHALVLNLSLAEFINSLNNSVSGIIYVRDRELRPGAACTINGLIGQLSVQAADFSILAIALVTLLTVVRITYMPQASFTKKALICLAVWAIPALTAVIATAMGEMTSVGGNWCWISANRPDLRYGLAHGWRFIVIFGTIAIYIYIWIYLRRQFGSPSGLPSWLHGSPATSNASSGFSSLRKDTGFLVMRDEDMELDDLNGKRKRLDEESGSPSDTVRDGKAGRRSRQDPSSTKELGLNAPAASHPGPSNHRPRPSMGKMGQGAMLQTNASEFPIRRESHQVEREIRRMLLLNAYPFMYVVLWIPGLVNRLMEASGSSPSHETMAALQVSTQFVGFANALTYGFNHHLRDRLKGIYITRIRPRLRR